MRLTVWSETKLQPLSVIDHKCSAMPINSTMIDNDIRMKRSKLGVRFYSFIVRL